MYIDQIFSCCLKGSSHTIHHQTLSQCYSFKQKQWFDCWNFFISSLNDLVWSNSILQTCSLTRSFKKIAISYSWSRLNNWTTSHRFNFIANFIIDQRLNKSCCPIWLILGALTEFDVVFEHFEEISCK